MFLSEFSSKIFADNPDMPISIECKAFKSSTIDLRAVIVPKSMTKLYSFRASMRIIGASTTTLIVSKNISKPDDFSVSFSLLLPKFLSSVSVFDAVFEQ